MKFSLVNSFIFSEKDRQYSDCTWKKNFLFSIALALLMLSGLVIYVMGSVGPLQIVSTITLDSDPKCIAINEETNRVYIGVEDGLLIIDCETATKSQLIP